jgi:DNA-binding MarR family transcriptional regulator
MEFDNQYIVIFGWMSSKLHLKGNYRDAFALVYGFSQDGKSEFRGTLTYIQKWLNVSRPTAVAVMDELVRRNLILKRKGSIDGRPRNFYRTNLEEVARLKNLTSKETLPVTSKETLPVTSKETLPVTSKETLLNNIESNIGNNIREEETNVSPAPAKPKRKRFVPPTFEDVAYAFQKKLREKKVLGAERLAEIEAEKFMNHYEANGWRVGKNKMKSWPHAVSGWISRMDQYQTTVNKTNKLEVDESPISPEDAHAIIDHFVAQGGF